MKIEAILTPIELSLLAKRDLSQTACIVFDVLRATSTFVTALHNGAKSIIPVSEISEALEFKKKQPDVLLGGERKGVRISADGIDFDLGNSPREYTPEKIYGRTIVSTTTNGTRALRACANAKIILAASFLNMSATAAFLKQTKFDDILLVCAGTGENASLEDVVAAGALCTKLIGKLSDSAQITRTVYEQSYADLGAAICGSENARRLLTIPELRSDIGFCLRQDVFDLVAVLGADGALDALV